MTERVAIVTRYMQREICHAALQLADSATRYGLPVRLIGRNDCNNNVSHWDRHVIPERFTNVGSWMQGCSSVIWTQVPSMFELGYAKEHGIATALLVNWEELQPVHEGILRELDKIIVPYKCTQAALASHCYLKHVKVCYLPWVTRAPLCKPNLLRKGLVVHFPLYDSQPARADQHVFKLMSSILSEFPAAIVSVACGHKWSRSSRALLKQLKKDYNNRLVTYAAPGAYERLELFAKADLTVWAPRFESFALIGLMSLAMSTPVISWDIRPQTEYLQGWKNSVLVPCETNSNWLDIPEVVGGYARFEELLLSTLHDRALLAKLKCSASNGLDARRKQFDAAWSDFIKKD